MTEGISIAPSQEFLIKGCTCFQRTIPGASPLLTKTVNMASFRLLSVFLLSIISLAFAAPIAVETDYDVIVIGGGPAGLSATSGLSRVQRRTLMLDSGIYRNDATRHMHDVIGNDGTLIIDSFLYAVILQYYRNCPSSLQSTGSGPNLKIQCDNHHEKCNRRISRVNQ